MLGAALEALLLCMVVTFPDEVEKALSAIKDKNFKKRLKKKNIELWSLSELLKIAFKAGWIPFDENKVANPTKLGNFLYYYVKNKRNLIHPGKAVRELEEIFPGKGDYEVIQELIDITIKYLSAKVNRALAEELGFTK